MCWLLITTNLCIKFKRKSKSFFKSSDVFVFSLHIYLWKWESISHLTQLLDIVQNYGHSDFCLKGKNNIHSRNWPYTNKSIIFIFYLSFILLLRTYLCSVQIVFRNKTSWLLLWKFYLYYIIISCVFNANNHSTVFIQHYSCRSNWLMITLNLKFI